MTPEKYSTDEQRWRAVRTRDPEAECLFVYCVKTTKIYCRPICKARLARRSNVEFFDTASEAETACYRACKRCKPQLGTYVPEADQMIEKTRKMLESLPDGAPLPKLDALAADAGLTKYHFHRSFKKATALTPREYALSRRRNRRPAGEGLAPQDESSISTPSLMPNTTVHLSATQSSNSMHNVNFNMDDWNIDSLDDGLLFNDYLFSPEGGDNNIHEIAPDPLFCDDEMKETLDNLPSSITVYYSTIEMTRGTLLMAFQDGQLCRMELSGSMVEVMASMPDRFPFPTFLLLPTDQLQDERERLAIQEQVDAVVQALEQPTSRIVQSSINARPNSGAE